MKIKEEWVRWNPISNLSQHYYVKSIIDTMNTFHILLCDSNSEDKELEIKFDGPIEAYRKTVEGFRCQLFLDLDKQCKDNFYSEWNFFKVKNSQYVKWIANQSVGITSEDELEHFVVMDDDVVIDFVSSFEPKVTFLK